MFPQDHQLSAELETLLSGVGLPIAETSDRTRAVGLVITELAQRIATIEWFVSPAARAAAAKEQTEGVVDGHAVVLHRLGRNSVQWTVWNVLRELGYTVTQDPGGALTVDGTALPVAGADAARALSECLPGVGRLDEGRARRDRRREDGDDGSVGLLLRV